jgi:hypothetical protein
VDLRADLDDVEKRKFLTLPGPELRPLGRPARSQSLYRLRSPVGEEHDAFDRGRPCRRRAVRLRRLATCVHHPYLPQFHVLGRIVWKEKFIWRKPLKQLN